MARSKRDKKPRDAMEDVIAKQNALMPEGPKAGAEFGATVYAAAAISASATTGAVMEAVIGQVPSEFLANYTIWQEVRKETDRGAAILAVAYLEAILKDVISSVFYVNDESKAIFGPDGPLVSLDAKCRLGYYLGFYGKSVKDDIKQIGTIRNSFAHRKELLTFQNTAISAMCYKIKYVYKPYYNINPENPPRSRYLGAIQGIGFILAAELARVERATPLPPLVGD